MGIDILRKEDVQAAIAAAKDIHELDAAIDIADQHRITLLAKVWANARYGAGADLTEAQIEEAFERAQKELDGDLAVRATLRALESVRAHEHLRSDSAPVMPPPPFWDQFIAMAKRNGSAPHQLQYKHFYDTHVGTGAEVGRCRLFANTHIGQPDLTNLQIGGQFTYSDGAAVTTRWWIDTLPRIGDLHGVCTFVANDRPVMQSQLHTLSRGKMSMFALLPPRTQLSADLDVYGPTVVPRDVKVVLHVEAWIQQSVI